MTTFAQSTSALFVLDASVAAHDEAQTASRMFPDDVEWTVLATTQDDPAHTSGETGFASEPMTPEEMEMRRRADRVDADGAIAATARGLGDRPVHQLVEVGDSVDAVHSVLAAQAYDVVVAGSPELAERLVEGGVPRVLVVPASVKEANGPALIAIDDSPTDDHVASAISALIGVDAECIAVHITAMPVTGGAVASPSSAGITVPVVPNDELDDADRRSVAESVERVRLRDVTPDGAAGDPATSIIDVAREHDAALIALATHQRGWLSHLVRPSVSDSVIRHAQRPVLIVTTPQAESDSDV